MTDIVPFGKYRGRPLVDLIADRSYTDWLAAQPWFRERYQTVYNLIVNTGAEPQDTPEHNKMQARYLDHDACLSLVRRWFPSDEDLRRTWHEDYGQCLTERQRSNLAIAAESDAAVTGLKFEAHGWDLLIEARLAIPITQHRPADCDCRCDPERCDARGQWDAEAKQVVYREPHSSDVTWSNCFWSGGQRRNHCSKDCPSQWDYHYHLGARAIAHSLTAAVELKPVLGDDYPTVLRAVIKRRQMCTARSVARADCTVVLVDEIQLEGVDLPAVRKIFRTQNVTLLTSADLPSPTVEWRCTCKDCVSP